jgi:hypothetical protein
MPDGSKAVADHCRPTIDIDDVNIAVPLIFGGSHSRGYRAASVGVWEQDYWSFIILRIFSRSLLISSVASTTWLVS